jgi:hypothetical protein
LDRVVQVTLLIADPRDYAEINAEYVRHFPRGLPARHTARFVVPTTAKMAFPASPSRATDRDSRAPREPFVIVVTHAQAAR